MQIQAYSPQISKTENYTENGRFEQFDAKWKLSITLHTHADAPYKMEKFKL